jgi:hypothetical protein
MSHMGLIIVTVCLFTLVIGGGALMARRERTRRLPADTKDTSIAGPAGAHNGFGAVSGKDGAAGTGGW